MCHTGLSWGSTPDLDEFNSQEPVPGSKAVLAATTETRWLRGVAKNITYPNIQEAEDQGFHGTERKKKR